MTEQTAPQAGQEAPDFTLPDADGAEWRLSEQRGRTVVLLFYPGDETPVCTRQLCAVRDRWEDYSGTGAEVVGISTDSVEKHRRFADNRKLPLRLLSDPEAHVVKLYGVASWLPGRAARAVVVIDPRGRVSYRKVQPVSLLRPKDDEVIAAIRAAGGGA
jgi:thioredoxin-dependent peroxiredoxin